MSRVLIISDNITQVTAFAQLVQSSAYSSHEFAYSCSKGSESVMSDALTFAINPLIVKREINRLIEHYDLIISIHCKQLFPKRLVESVRCINVHPGLNPYNRGWFPQVFSILNGLPTGATIHEMDHELDHGDIIAQRKVSINKWDVSIDIYNRVLCAEMELLEEHLPAIIDNSYSAFRPNQEGNLNLKQDFNALCKLDLKKKQSIGETLNLLRALTHGDYQNGYFIDDETGKKVFVSVSLKVEKNSGPY